MKKPIRVTSELIKRIDEAKYIEGLILKNRKHNSTYSKTAYHIRNCYMGLERWVNGQRQGDFLGCHSPLCPICQHTRLMKELAINHGIFDHLIAHADYRGVYWYHWILSIEPCEAHQLVSTSQHLWQGFSRLLKTAEVDRVMLGASAYLHVKLKDAYGSIRPHYHCMVGMKPSYKGKRYISIDRLGLLWQEALGVGYQPYANAIALPLKNGYPERHDFINLIGYAARPVEMSNLREYPQTYLDYADQAWGLRKVRHVGMLAALRKRVRQDYAEQLAQAQADRREGRECDALTSEDF